MIKTENDAWDGLEIDLRGAVYHRQARMQLAPKEEAVLHLLLERWPSSVSKSDFARNVWGNRAMSDESLARCVTKARQELGRDSPVYIKSEYGSGYRIELRIKTDQPVPVKSDANHLRLLDTARAPSSLVETVSHCGNLIALRNDYGIERAELLLREALKNAPDYKAARIMLAKCLAARITTVIGDELNLVDEGLNLLKADVERGTPAVGLLTQWAHLLDCAWRFREARKYHLEAIRLFPQDSETYYHYGWHLLITGAPEQAAETLKIASELHPFSVLIGLLHARALQSSGRVEASMKIVHDLHNKFPDNAVATLYWTTIQATQAPSPLLHDEARKIHGSRVPWPLAGSNLAFIYARCGDIELARKLIATTYDSSTALQGAYMPPLFYIGEEQEALRRAEALFSQRCGMAPFMLRLNINRSMIVKSERGRTLLRQFDAQLGQSDK